MAHVRPREPVLPFASAFSPFPAALAEVRARLVDRFGPPLRELGPIAFAETSYYAPEMGADLVRRLWVFARPEEPTFLAAAKHWTNELEAALLGRPEYPRPRPVNIDPGYLSTGKLVLASLKDHAHRIDVGGGVFEEVTLHFRKGRFEPWPWTYPDYASERYRAFLEEARAAWLERLRGEASR